MNEEKPKEHRSDREVAKAKSKEWATANPHRYGIIDVIKILDGEITLLSEKEVKTGSKLE